MGLKDSIHTYPLFADVVFGYIETVGFIADTKTHAIRVLGEVNLRVEQEGDLGRIPRR